MKARSYRITTDYKIIRVLYGKDLSNISHHECNLLSERATKLWPPREGLGYWETQLMGQRILCCCHKNTLSLFIIY